MPADPASISPPAFPGLTVLELLSHSARSSIWKARRSDGEGVLLKIGRGSSDPRANTQLEREALARCAGPGVVACYGTVDASGISALLLEDLSATRAPLQQILEQGERLDAITCIPLLLALAEALDTIHRAGVVHTQIHPRNILVSSELDSVALIDFADASLVREQMRMPQVAGSLETPLRYCSPEQTGRFNRPVDYRSDYYSLGCVAYHLLVGRPPFEGSPTDLVFAHVADTPIALEMARPDIPQALSRIVSKLLAKEPADRYQSSRALSSDLRQSLHALQNETGPGSIELSKDDRPGYFRMPHGLYGRDRDIAKLNDQLEVAMAGESALLLVQGAAGVGKSALVRESLRGLARNNCRVGFGKFDQLARSIPYSALLQALRELLLEIIAEPQAQLELWRRRLQEALAPNADLLVGGLPELGWILGPQPAIRDVGSAEAQTRFNQTFLALLDTLGQRELPTTIFLDDLQWVDAPTATMLRMHIAERARDSSLFFIGAFRGDEVGPGHPLDDLKRALANTGALVQQLDLTPLTGKHTAELVRDTVADAPGSPELAELVQGKTAGNPFFVAQFLTNLAERGLLEFDARAGHWTWDLDLIISQSATENVAATLVSRLQRLDPVDRHILRTAACFGEYFELDTLSRCLDMDRSELLSRLRGVIDDGFVTALARTQRRSDGRLARQQLFRFAHDRVRSTAHDLPGEDLARTHLRVGRMLLESNAQDQNPAALFEIVRHLALGQSEIRDAEERLQFARLAFDAGELAMAGAAYRYAIDCFDTALGALSEEQKLAPQNYLLVYSTAARTAEARYLAGDFEQARLDFQSILGKAKTQRHRADVERTLLILETHEGHYARAIDIAVESLAMLGYPLPRHPSKPQVLRALFSTSAALLRHSRRSILDAETLQDADVRTAVDTMLAATPAIYQQGENNLLAMVAFASTKLNLDHGLAPSAGYSFTMIGLMQGAILGRYRRGLEFGRLGIELFERFDVPDMSCRAHLVQGAFIHNWVLPIRDSFAPLERAYDLGIACGNVTFAGYSLYFRTLAHLHMGTSLGGLLEFCERGDPLLRRIRDTPIWVGTLACGELARQLSGDDSSQSHLIHPQFGDPQSVYHEAHGTVRLSLHVNRLMLGYLTGDRELANRQAKSIPPLLETGMSSLLLSAWALFGGLHACSEWSLTTARAERWSLVRMIRRSLRQLARWARSSPRNFRHQHLLLRGEWLRVRGRDREALELLEEAATHAREEGMTHHVAIANELATRAARSAGRMNAAGAYFASAQEAYERWGATACVRRLQQQHSDLASRPKLELTSPSVSSASPVDLEAALQASQAISGEVVLERLLESLTRILATAAGAQRGVLVHDDHDGLEVAAIFEVTDSEADDGSTRLEELVPAALVRFVMRTGETVVVSNEGDQVHRFAGDSYFRLQSPKSIACAPIRQKDRIVGAVYLEHADATRVFTEERMEVLKALFAQAAISLENARLYSDLERESEERLAAEREQRLLEQELLQAKKVEALGRLAGGVAHDFNNLLMAILGSAELLGDDRVEDSLRIELADEIAEAGNKAADLVRQLMAFSRGGEVLFQPVDVHDVLEAVVRLLRRTVDPSIAVECLAAAESSVVSGDRAQLENAVLNLALNARDAMPEGGTLTLSTRVEAAAADDHREAQLEPHGDWLCLEVRDTGVGMDRSVRERVFDPFYTTKDIGQGTGLGLAAVYGTVQNHQGQITVQSSPGCGSTFAIRLPLARTEPIHVDEPLTTTPPRPLRRQGLVLVVDDNSSVRRATAAMLRRLGYDAVTAEGGVQAVETYRRLYPHVDLVILDMLMPNMTGTETLEALRHIDPEVHAAFATGQASRDGETPHLDDDSIGVLRKPYSLAQLRERLGEWIRTDTNGRELPN